jgi:SlyX protein
VNNDNQIMTQVNTLKNEFVNLQTQFAYSNESIEALEKTVMLQHTEIELLKKQIKILSEHLKTLKQEGVIDVRDDVPPPHY